MFTPDRDGLRAQAEGVVDKYRHGGASLEELSAGLEQVVSKLRDLDFEKSQELITESWGEIEAINATALHRKTSIDRDEIDELINDFVRILSR